MIVLVYDPYEVALFFGKNWTEEIRKNKIGKPCYCGNPNCQSKKCLKLKAYLEKIQPV